MESVFSAFIRVLRNLDTADGLLAIFQEFEKKPSALSAEYRIRLLDFPDLATQEANITAIASTTSTKQDFLKKAAESPRDLTTPEIDLLRDRYWSNLTFAEKDAFEDALFGLPENSDQEDGTDSVNRLRGFQTYLYEKFEGQAIANAHDEDERRRQEECEDEKQQDLQTMLQHGHPWLRRLWEEDGDEKHWGYAIFENPQWKAEDPDRWESYERKSDKAKNMALGAISCGFTIQSNYLIEDLDWPAEAPTEDDKFPVVVLGELRKRFNYLRSLPPKKEAWLLGSDCSDCSDSSAGTMNKIPEGLTVGTLRNVFLYLDGNSAASVLENRLADDFWIWAVDPDHVEDSENQSSSGYKGFLRVRLQQLLNNFYVARRWHADEVSLEDLWKAAQKDPHNGSFVSLEDEEIFAQNLDWEVATAVRSKNAWEGQVV